jgi:hypothetical protein
VITSNAIGLAEKWQKRASVLAPMMRKATADATKVLYAESKRQMESLIYSKPEDTKEEVAIRRGTIDKLPKSEYKKKAWRRTGNLKRSERFKTISAFVGIVENNASQQLKSGKHKRYARARHDMPSPRRRAPWRTKAINKTRLKIRDLYRTAMKKALHAGLLD